MLPLICQELMWLSKFRLISELADKKLSVLVEFFVLRRSQWKSKPLPTRKNSMLTSTLLSPLTPKRCTMRTKDSSSWSIRASSLTWFSHSPSWISRRKGENSSWMTLLSRQTAWMRFLETKTRTNRKIKRGTIVTKMRKNFSKWLDRRRAIISMELMMTIHTEITIELYIYP